MQQPPSHMLVAAMLMLLAVSSCADDNKGKIVHPNIPQAAEQCVAQPDLAWCKK